MSSTLVVPGPVAPGLSLRNEPFPESFGVPGPAGAAEAPGQFATRPPSRVTTGARPLEPATTPANPDLRCWVKFERDPNAAYNGEYGFDWMDWQRDPDPKNLNDEITEVMGVPISAFEYCYNEMAKDEKGKISPQYVAVAQDPHLKRKLQGEYRRVLVYGEDYYAAWLSVRPGQEVKLRLRVEALNTDPVQEDYHDGKWIYYTYQNGKRVVLRTQHFTRGLPDGKDTVIINDTLHVRRFRNGTGTWQLLTRQKRLVRVQTFTQGYADGTWRYYAPDGSLTEKRIYQKGQLVRRVEHGKSK